MPQRWCKRCGCRPAKPTLTVCEPCLQASSVAEETFIAPVKTVAAEPRDVVSMMKRCYGDSR